ncbi:vanadium nitrogenase [Lachnospiraceae bacterium ZAX-1]
MAFLGSFIEYIIRFVILAAVAVGGLFLGKFLRVKKDAKEAAVAASEQTKE